MDKKSSILIGIFLVMVICAVGVTFYRYIIKEDIIFYTDEAAFQESLLEE